MWSTKDIHFNENYSYSMSSSSLDSLTLSKILTGSQVLVTTPVPTVILFSRKVNFCPHNIGIDVGRVNRTVALKHEIYVSDDSIRYVISKHTTVHSFKNCVRI